MPAISKTILRVDRGGTGAIAVNDTNGNAMNFASVSDMAEFASEPITNEMLFKLLIAYWLQRNPTAANDNIIEDLIITYDAAQAASVVDIRKAV